MIVYLVELSFRPGGTFSQPDPLMVSVINQIEGPMTTLRDGRDQVKFPPTCGKPTTFRAKCERPLQSVMNFGSAAEADGHEYPFPGNASPDFGGRSVASRGLQ